MHIHCSSFINIYKSKIFTNAKPEHFPNCRETVARIQENGPKDRLEEVPKNFGHLDKLALDYTQHMENVVGYITPHLADGLILIDKTKDIINVLSALPPSTCKGIHLGCQMGKYDATFKLKQLKKSFFC